MIGVNALRRAWADFDAFEETHASEWRERTSRAIEDVAGTTAVESGVHQQQQFLIREWPMPLVHMDLSLDKTMTLDDLRKERELVLTALADSLD